MIIVMIEDLDRQVLELVVNCRKIILHKVHRCLARYSPRAITTNRPTNRALNSEEACMAWPKLNKNANFGPNLVVLGQKILFFTGEISVSELAVIFWGSPLFLAVLG